MLHRLFPALGLLAALGACQAGEALTGAFEGTMGATYDYAALQLPLTIDTAESVAVTVIDERPYVVNGDESPSFVGTLPGRYRNTIDVTTESGRPLADLVTDAIAAALRRQGVVATAVPLAKATAEAEALAALNAAGAERLLVVRIGEWQTNAHVRVSAHWQLEATVYDRAGEVLGQRRSQGTQNIGTTGFDEETAELAVSAFRERLTYLLGDPAITRAFGGA